MVDLYTRQSSLSVTARDLATMGATLALGDATPLTPSLQAKAGSRERVVDEGT